MNIALWIVQALLALAFGMAGFLKVTRTKEQLAPMMKWVNDYPPKLIGGLELLAAIGLILPWATGTAKILTPLAASGLVIIQLLAIVMVHGKAKEYAAVAANVVLGGLALFVALGRF